MTKTRLATEASLAGTVTAALANNSTVKDAAAAAVQGEVSSRKLVDFKEGFPTTDIAGGFQGENGRATDLVVDSAGKVTPPVMEDWANRIKGITGLIESKSSVLYSGFAGENDRITELVVDPQGNVPDEVLTRWASRMEVPTSEINEFSYMSGPDILTVGDSLTASGNIAGKLSSLTGRTVRNMGVGGETNPTILGRLGVWPFEVIIPSGGIPASGSVDVTLRSSYDGLTVSPNLQGTGVRGESDGFLWGTLKGERVYISLRINEAGPPVVRQWQITRQTPGAAIPTPLPEIFLPEHGSARSGDIVIAWIGQNGPSDETTFAGYQALEQWMTKAGKRFLVASKPTGSNTGWTDFEKSLRARWGRRYINIRRFLIDEAPTLMGLTLTEQDQADIAAGVIPTQLRTDSTHHTAAAQQCMAEFLHYPRLKELRYL